MNLLLLRHAPTPATVAKRYQGRLDEPLDAAGKRLAQEAGCWPEQSVVFVSPLQRARQTARLCFPNARHQVVAAFREMDFGVFEGQTAAELAENPAYTTWVAGLCQGQVPGGDHPDLYRAGVVQAFGKIVEEAILAELSAFALVAHAGTLMAIMTAFARPARPFFDWQVPPCGGYSIQIDPARWQHSQHFSHQQQLVR